MSRRPGRERVRLCFEQLESREVPSVTVWDQQSFDDLARVTVSAEVGHDETLTLTKYLAYG